MADELYKGYVITEHYGIRDTPHYHYGMPNEQGRITVPLDCRGPADKATRDMYGSNMGGCGSPEECRSEIDQLTE